MRHKIITNLMLNADQDTTKQELARQMCKGLGYNIQVLQKLVEERYRYSSYLKPLWLISKRLVLLLRKKGFVVKRYSTGRRYKPSASKININEYKCTGWTFWLEQSLDGLEDVEYVAVLNGESSHEAFIVFTAESRRIIANHKDLIKPSLQFKTAIKTNREKYKNTLNCI